MKRVMVVCSGNICRSPMAAALVERELKELKIPALVISAGTLGIHGQPASSHAVTALREVGLDISSHRSQGVSPQMLGFSDYVLVMEPQHEAHIRQKAPQVGERIHRLWEYVEPKGSLTFIPDPVGLDLGAFQICRDQLTAAIKNWGRWISTIR